MISSVRNTAPSVRRTTLLKLYRPSPTSRIARAAPVAKTIRENSSEAREKKATNSTAAIAKISGGKDTAGLIRYLFDTKKAKDHTDPHLVASWDGFAPDPGRADDFDATKRLLVADLDLLGGHVEDAFARLIDLVRRTAGPERDRTRVHLLELFAVVGNDDPRVLAGRRSLASALF